MAGYLLNKSGVFLVVCLGCKHDPPVQPAPDNSGTSNDPGNDNNPNKPGNPTGNLCDPVKLNFQRDVLPILLSNCTMSRCHTGSLAYGGYNFSTHGGLATAVNTGKLVGAVSQKPGFRPMAQGGRLTDCRIARIKKWVALGTHYN